MSTPVFISYSSKDQDIAETICQALEGRGLECWISSRDVHPGENFQEAIVKALRAARVMMLVFTANANNSDEIKKELVLAGRHRVTIVPVRVEDVIPNDAFTYEFATRQWIDLFKDWEREIDRLGAQIETINASPKAGVSEGVVNYATPVPRSKPSKPSYVPVIAAALVILPALGIGGYLYTRKTPAAPPIAAVQAAPAPAPGILPTASAPPAPPVTPVTSPAPQAPSAPSAPSAPQPVTSASTGTFDGAWSITFTCPPASGALGYSYRVAAKITDGFLHGEKGEKGKPGWLTIDGKIGADGSLNNLYVDSLVGASQYAVGNVAKGSEFGYHVAGKLNDMSGAGSRVEGRPCTLDFAKQGP